MQFVEKCSQMITIVSAIKINHSFNSKLFIYIFKIFTNNGQNQLKPPSIDLFQILCRWLDRVPLSVLIDEFNQMWTVPGITLDGQHDWKWTANYQYRRSKKLNKHGPHEGSIKAFAFVLQDRSLWNFRMLDDQENKRSVDPVTVQCTKGSDLAPHWLIQVHCINYVLGLLFDDLNLAYITIQNLGPSKSSKMEVFW